MPPRDLRVTLLAGGTGGARLAAGLAAELPPGALTVVVNTADDDEFWGLHVSPDVDSVLYRLAGIFNDSTGFGVAGETFAMLEQLRRYGEDAWFALGDRDTATHLVRTRALRAGRTLTEATAELCERLHLSVRVLPMSDDRVRTVFRTPGGTLRFQEWFVREHCRPRVREITFEGLAAASGTAAGRAALRDSDRIVVGPSNPLISIEPIAALYRDELRALRRRVVAVTPLVGGRALKGPTVDLLRDAGEEPTVRGVARRYAGWAATFILDTADTTAAAGIEALGYRVHTCDTVMGSAAAERALARQVLAV